MAEELRILLIEHDAAFARYLVGMLGQAREMKAEVTWAQTLGEGLQDLAGGDYAVVLMDIAVPDGAGLANMYLTAALAPKVPVILAGERDEGALAVEAVQGGAQDYLVKGQLTAGWLERSVRYAIERYGMEMALRQAEEKYHGLFDHLVEGIFQTTPEGSYLLANAALARIYGYSSPEELMEQTRDVRRVYVDPNRRQEFVELMRKQEVINDFESPVYRKDGSIIWISENCRTVRNASGELLYYEGTVEDITSRRQAEEALRNSEALYHSLVETLPQNIFRKDLEGRFTFANQQFCKTLGKQLDEIVGKNDSDFFPPELAAKYQRDDRRVLETGRNYETIEENQPPGKEKMYVRVVKTPIPGADGKFIGLQGIFWDITQQHLAEERIRRVNQLLSQSRRELRIKNAQMEDDMKMAREIQFTMLPQQYPTFPPNASEAESALRFTHRYLPTGSVGGDFFSVSALSESLASVFICDVAGHGVRSALVTAMVRALVEELKPLAVSPGQFLTKLNSDLYAILKHTGTPMLTTAFYMICDYRTGVAQYANAGHPRPLHVKRPLRLVGTLANPGSKSQPALGLFEDAVYETGECHLDLGDVFLLYTDGLYEVQDRNNELYTQAMLVTAVQERLLLPMAELIDDLLAEVRRFSQGSGFTDDVCLVGMELSQR